MRVTILALGVLALMGAPSARAQLGGAIGISRIYTDNLALARPGLEETERLTELTTGFRYRREQQRLEADVAYQAQGLFYDDNDTLDEVFHQLNAQATFEAIQDRFFLEAIAQNDQTIVSPQGALLFNNVQSTANRIDVKRAQLSPYLSLEVADRLEGEMRYVHGALDYDDDMIQDSEFRAGYFDLSTISETGASWGIGYGYERQDFDIASEVEFQYAQVELGYWLDALQLFTTQGLEDDFRRPTEADLDERYWEAGVRWRPSSRTDMQAALGERSFGRTARFQWNYSLRRGTISVSYSEDPNTVQRLQLGEIRPVGQTQLDAVLDAAGDGDVFLQKRFDAQFSVGTDRTNLALRAYRERRVDRIVSGIQTNENEDVRGVEIDWSWRLRRDVSFYLSISAAEIVIGESGVADDLEWATLGLSYDVGQRFQLLLEARRNKQTPNSDLRPGYKENQVELSLIRSFGNAQGISLTSFR